VIGEFTDVSHKDTLTLSEVTLVISEDDVFFENLPSTLPPMCDIQHANESTPGTSLLDLPHHRKNPTLHVELKWQVDDLSPDVKQ